MNGWNFKEFNAYSYLENFQDPNLVFSSNQLYVYLSFQIQELLLVKLIIIKKSIFMGTTKYHNIFTTK